MTDTNQEIVPMDLKVKLEIEERFVLTEKCVKTPYNVFTEKDKCLSIVAFTKNSIFTLFKILSKVNLQKRT